MRKAWSALALVAIVSTSRLASAEPAPLLPLELVWEAPEACPGAESVRRRIGQILHASVAKPTSAVARGRIETLPEGRLRLAMAVRTGDVEDVRTVDAASCSTLAEAFAVVVALAIDSTINPGKEVGGGEGPAPASSSLPESAEPPESPRAEPVPAPPVAPAKSESPALRSVASRLQLRPEIGLGGFVVWGPLPEASVGPVLSLGARIHRFRAGALAAVSLSQDARFDRSAGATFDMASAGAFGGYMAPVGAFAFGPAVSVEVTHVRARGFGIRQPWETSAVWLTPALGGRFEARAAKWLALFAAADCSSQSMLRASPSRPRPRGKRFASIRRAERPLVWASAPWSSFPDSAERPEPAHGSTSTSMFVDEAPLSPEAKVELTANLIPSLRSRRPKQLFPEFFRDERQAPREL